MQVRFRAADLGGEEGLQGGSGGGGGGWDHSAKVAWTRKLDLLPPKARRAAFECRDEARRRGPAHLEALAYGVT